MWQAFFKFKETYNVPVLLVRLPIKKNIFHIFLIGLSTIVIHNKFNKINKVC